jgi:hypothetical protein
MNVRDELHALELELLGAGKWSHRGRTIRGGRTHPRADDHAIAAARARRKKQHGHEQAPDGSTALSHRLGI